MDTSTRFDPIPAFHPGWCEISSHQDVLNDFVHPYRAHVRTHWARGGEGLLPELRWGERSIRDFGGTWALHIEQQPLCDDDKSGTSGWPFIHLWVAAPGYYQANLTLTGGEARTLAAQLLEVADKVDMPDRPTT